MNNKDTNQDFSGKLHLNFSTTAHGARPWRKPLWDCMGAVTTARSALSPCDCRLSDVCHLARFFKVQHMHEPPIQFVDAQDHRSD